MQVSSWQIIPTLTYIPIALPAHIWHISGIIICLVLYNNCARSRSFPELLFFVLCHRFLTLFAQFHACTNFNKREKMCVSKKKSPLLSSHSSLTYVQKKRPASHVDSYSICYTIRGRTAVRTAFMSRGDEEGQKRRLRARLQNTSGPESLFF